MGHLEFEGFDTKTTRALEEKAFRAATSPPAVQHAVVVAFLESVDSEGQDVREEVHGCTLDELTEQLAVLGAVNDLGVTYAEATYLAGRLREIVRHPEEG